MHFTFFSEERKREIEQYKRETKQRQINFIYSRNWVDCGVACFAMAKDISYEQAAEIVKPKKRFGTSAKTLAKLLGGKYQVYRNPRAEFLSFQGNGKNMILLTLPDQRDEAGHFVVKDSEDVVYDPDNEEMSMESYAYANDPYHLVYASVEFPKHVNGEMVEPPLAVYDEPQESDEPPAAAEEVTYEQKLNAILAFAEENPNFRNPEMYASMLERWKRFGTLSDRQKSAIDNVFTKFRLRLKASR